MWYQPGVQVPRRCPLCGFRFWFCDGHDRRALSALAKAEEALRGHDARAHGGLLGLIARHSRDV